MGVTGPEGAAVGQPREGGAPAHMNAGQRGPCYWSVLGRLEGRRAAPRFPWREQGRGHIVTAGLPNSGHQDRAGSRDSPGQHPPGLPVFCGLCREAWEGMAAIMTSVCPVTALPSPGRLCSPTHFHVGPSRVRGRGCPVLRLCLCPLSSCLRWPLSCHGPVFTVCVRVCACFDAGTTLS